MKFKVGDVVKINAEGLRAMGLTPRRMVLELGMPNKFHIHTLTGQHIILSECCRRELLRNATCTSHPDELFDLCEENQPKGKIWHASANELTHGDLFTRAETKEQAIKQFLAYLKKDEELLVNSDPEYEKIYPNLVMGVLEEH